MLVRNTFQALEKNKTPARDVLIKRNYSKLVKTAMLILAIYSYQKKTNLDVCPA